MAKLMIAQASGGTEGCCIEVFNALRGTVALTAGPEADLEPLREGGVFRCDADMRRRVAHARFDGGLRTLLRDFDGNLIRIQGGRLIPAPIRSRHGVSE